MRVVALEPELFDTWIAWQTLIRMGFGVPNGRFISNYPEKGEDLRGWCGRVRDVVRAAKKAGKIGPVKANTITSELEAVRKLKLVDPPVEATFSGDEWIENAVREQSDEDLWDAVITRNHSIVASRIYRYDELDFNDPGLATDARIIPRRKSEIVQFAKCFLGASNKVHFVDPYFFPTDIAFNEPLCDLLEAAFEGRDVLRCTYHCSAKRISKPAAFQRELEVALGEGWIKIPAGGHLFIVLWADHGRADPMHARYILSDRGGLKYDYGLGEDDGKTTDVNYLEERQWVDRLKGYSPSGRESEILGAWHIDEDGTLSSARPRRDRFEKE